MFLVQGDTRKAWGNMARRIRGKRMQTMSFMKKFDQSVAELKAAAEPHLRRLYQEAVKGYINFRKRGTILLKAFCHNAINTCMGLSLKSFAALTLVPAVVVFFAVDVSSKGERDAVQLRAAIAAQLAHSRMNTNQAAAAQAAAAAQQQQQQHAAQIGIANASLLQQAADVKKIVPPILPSEAFMSFVGDKETPRDADAYLKEGLKAAKQIEPAAGGR